MCSGDFKCEGRGVFRFPSKKFFDKMKFLNEREELDFDINKNYNYRNIKIPDIYEITLNFQSLLPDNFNNYLMQYSSFDNKLVEPPVYSQLFEPIKREMDSISEAAQSDSVRNAESKAEAAWLAEDMYETLKADDEAM